MTPEERKMLEETRVLVGENRVILEGIRKANKNSLIFKYLYWGVIVLLSFGAYYAMQPYINTLQSSLGSINNTGTN